MQLFARVQFTHKLRIVNALRTILTFGVFNRTVPGRNEFPQTEGTMSLTREELQGLEHRLESPDTRDAKVFRELLSDTIDLLNMSLREVADEFAVSPSSVTRWKQGANAPHPAMRPLVFKFLARKVAESRRRLEVRVPQRSAATAAASGASYAPIPWAAKNY
jgi:hypothetical protein